MNTNEFMIKALIVAAILFVIKLIYNAYRKRYFKSTAFSKLNRDTDHIEEQYQEIEYLSETIKQELYADFAPTYVEGEIQRIQNRYTYICNDDLINRLKSDQIATIKEYCGFTDSIGIVEKLEAVQNQLLKLERKYDKFKSDCEVAMQDVEKSVPGLIWFLSKKKVLLLLGMQTANLKLNGFLPQYIFLRRDGVGEVVVRFNSKMIGELLKR